MACKRSLNKTILAILVSTACLLVFYTTGVAADVENVPTMTEEQILEHSFAEYNAPVDMEDMELLSRAPFDPQNDPRDREILDHFLATNPDFDQKREAKIKLKYHMSLQEYDALHAKHRLSLLSLADAYKVPYVAHQDNYESLLTRVTEAIEKDAETKRQQSGAAGTDVTSFIDRSTLATTQQLKMAAFLFQGTKTLHTARVEDMLTWGIGEGVDKAVKWIKEQWNKHKCSICKGVAGFFTNAGCQLVGKGICAALAQLASPAVGALINKFICGWPVNAAGMIANFCSKQINKILEKKGGGPECTCDWSPSNITLPKMLGGGQLFPNAGKFCNPPEGRCAKHGAEAREKYLQEQANKPQEPKCKSVVECAKQKYENAKEKAKQVADLAKEVAKDPKAAWVKHRAAIGDFAAKKAIDIATSAAVNKLGSVAANKIGSTLKNNKHTGPLVNKAVDKFTATRDKTWSKVDAKVAKSAPGVHRGFHGAVAKAQKVADTIDKVKAKVSSTVAKVFGKKPGPPKPPTTASKNKYTSSSSSGDSKEPEKKPGAKKPAAKKPGAKKPAAKKPGAKKPPKPSKKPTAKKPTTKKPTSKKPATKKPATKKPSKKPTAKKPATKKPSKKPTAKKPATKKPSKKPTAKKPATKKPSKKPTAKKPATKKPSKKPIAKKPATKKPSKKPTAKKPTTKKPTTKKPTLKKML